MTSKSDSVTDPFSFAESIALTALAPRAKSRAELLAHLKKRGVEEEIAHSVLDKMELLGYLNDLDFAKTWIESRTRSKRLSSKALEQELRQRGVQDDLIREALTEVDQDQEFENAKELARRKLATTRGLAPEVGQRRMYSLLMRRGYSSSVINRVVRSLQDEESERGSDEGACAG